MQKRFWSSGDFKKLFLKDKKLRTLPWFTEEGYKRKSTRLKENSEEPFLHLPIEIKLLPHWRPFLVSLLFCCSYFFLHLHIIMKRICPDTVWINKMADSQKSYVQGYTRQLIFYTAEMSPCFSKITAAPKYIYLGWGKLLISCFKA